MTNTERLVRSQSILRRQNSGKLTKAEASAEFDRLLDESSGDLHYYSDTTEMRADWDGVPVMLFPTADLTPSNTGIITQGPDRGKIITKDGCQPNCRSDVFAHFTDLVASVQSPGNQQAPTNGAQGGQS